MTPIASPTATDAAINISSINLAQLTAMTADTMWPANAAQGCDSGPCGTPKTSTAEAHIEPTINAAELPHTNKLVSRKIPRMPAKPPTAETILSAWLTLDTRNPTQRLDDALSHSGITPSRLLAHSPVLLDQHTTGVDDRYAARDHPSSPSIVQSSQRCGPWRIQR